MHPFYSYDSPARALDMDLATTNAYAGPNHITSGIQHGSWSMPVDSGKPPQPSMLNSNQQAVRDDLQYSKEDLLAIEEWVKVILSLLMVISALVANQGTAPCRDDLALSGNLLHGSKGGQQHRQARRVGRATERPRRQGPQGRRSVNLPRQRRLQHILDGLADW